MLYELAHRRNPTASVLSKDLGLDAGYLSRILSGFEKQNLITRTQAPADARQSLLHLTRAGRAAFRPLDRQSTREAQSMLAKLSPQEKIRLVAAMADVTTLLDPPADPETPVVLRPPRPGDMGYVIHRHGALYAAEYHWDESFETLVAQIVAQFMQKFDPRREACWIAEMRSAIAGSVFLVRQSATVGRLRLLLVEPWARGHGVGGRLVAECIARARQCGYRKLTLWTQKNLHAARRIYERAGFELVREWPYHNFGHDMISQTWELKL